MATLPDVSGPPNRIHARRFGAVMPIANAICAAALTVVCLRARSEPIGSVIMPLPWSYLFWPAAIAVWVVWIVRWNQDILRGTLARRALSTVVPLCAAVVVYDMNTQWLLHGRFARSRPALEAAAREALGMAGTEPLSLGDVGVDGMFPEFVPYRRVVGAYRVTHVCVFPKDRVVLFQVGGFFRGGWGFAWHPDQPGVVIRDVSFSPTPEPGWSTFEYAKE